MFYMNCWSDLYMLLIWPLHVVDLTFTTRLRRIHQDGRLWILKVSYTWRENLDVLRYPWVCGPWNHLEQGARQGRRFLVPGYPYVWAPCRNVSKVNYYYLWVSRMWYFFLDLIYIKYSFVGQKILFLDPGQALNGSIKKRNETEPNQSKKSLKK